MIYLYWTGALLILSPLLLGLPLLSRNRVYRVATLFAGMNTGIVTLSMLINLLRWGAGPTYVDSLHSYFTASFPSHYIASLITGATLVARYYLNTSTRVGTISATIGCLIAVYLLSIFIARLLDILLISLTEGFPFSDNLLAMLDSFLASLTYLDSSFMILFFVSAFIALNGTAAAMRISNEAAPKVE
jgi:hypothetical protein